MTSISTIRPPDGELAYMLSEFYQAYDMVFDAEDVLNTLTCEPVLFINCMQDIGFIIKQTSLSMTSPMDNEQWIRLKLKVFKDFFDD